MTELTMKAHLENEVRLLDFLTDEYKRHGIPVQSEVLVAVEEVFVNIVQYAYLPKEGDITLFISLDSDAGKTIVRFEDSGKPFNPLERDAPNLDTPIMERQIGGLGIHFVKNLMDTVEYEYTDNKNVLTITKAITKGTAKS